MAETTKRLRILLADDHVTVRRGLKLLIDAERDMEVIGEAGDGNEAVQKARELNPDVIVMDISMPGASGLAATRTLKKIKPDAVIVTLTRHADSAYLQEAAARGRLGRAEAERAYGAPARDSRGSGGRSVSGHDADGGNHRQDLRAKTRGPRCRRPP